MPTLQCFSVNVTRRIAFSIIIIISFKQLKINLREVDVTNLFKIHLSVHMWCVFSRPTVTCEGHSLSYLMVA